MSKYWKVSRNGEKDFEDVYRDYKAEKITSTEAAYHLNLSQIGFLKRVKCYEKDNILKYETTTLEENKQALKLMETHIEKIKKFNPEFQDKLTDIMYRTCLYIVRHRNEIDNETNLIWFSLKRKCKDIRYEKSKNKEIKILNSDNSILVDRLIYNHINKKI